MANKPIGSLPAAAALQDADLLAIEQSGTAKKLVGEHLKSYVIAAAETAVEGAITPYIEEAEGYAESAESAKDIVVSAVDVARQAETLAVQAKEGAQSAAADASSSKASAQTFAANAAASSLSASQASSTAHDEAERAKGYADQAAAAHDGVASFNARSGNVMPQEGDYTPEMLGLEPMSEVISAGPGGAPGKNLFKTAFDPQETTAVGNKVTKKGITAEIQYDGSIKLSGTSTGPVSFYFGYSSIHQEACDAITYSASILGDPQYISVSVQSGVTGSSPIGGRVPYTFTNVGEYDGYYYFIIYINGSNRKINATVRLQKEYNAEATSWEPYPASVKIENAAEGLLFKEVTAELPIMQETNGYANPWPGGGYRNLFNPDGLQTVAGAAKVKTLSVNGLTATIGSGERIIINGTTTGNSPSIRVGELTLPAGNYIANIELEGTYTGFSFFIKKGTSGSQVTPGGSGTTFTLTEDTVCCLDINYATGITASNLTIRFQIEAGSTLHDWSPYENICPIIPHSAVEVTRTGKNLLAPVLVNNAASVTVVGVTLTIYNQKFRLNGTATGSGGRTSLRTQPFTLRAGTYTVSADNTSTQFGAYITDLNSGTILTSISQGGASQTFTTTEDKTVYLGINVANQVVYSNFTLGIQLEVGSTASSWEAYNCAQYLVNIGINQWDEEWELGIIDGNGVDQANNSRIRSKNYTPCIAGAKYYASIVPIYVRYYDANKTFVGKDDITTNAYNPFTVPSGAAYMRFCMDASYGATYKNDISINYPSSFTEYYPYTGRQVYGGELDVTTGVLTSRYGYADLGSLTWYGNESGYWYTTALKNYGEWQYNNVTWAASEWNAHVWTGRTEGDIVVDGTKTLHCITSDTINRPKGQIVYKLASPLTIQLTPQQIKQLLGTNYIDAGDNKVTVTFRTSGIIASDDVSELIESEKILTAAPLDLTDAEALQARLNIGAGSNPNLLDNPFFQVNMTGTTTMTGSEVENRFVNRWKIGNNVTVTVNSAGITTTPPRNPGAIVTAIRQKIPNAQWFKGKTITLSFNTDMGVKTVTGTVPNAISNYWSAEGEYFNNGMYARLYMDTNNILYVDLICTSTFSGSAITVYNAKLERGSVSTILNDTPRDYGEELARCQRYDNEYINPTGAGYAVFSSASSSTTYADVIIPLPVPMRAKPTVTLTGGASLFNQSQQYVAVTSITVIGIMNNLLYIRVNASGLTAGVEYRLVLNASSKLSISCEP